MGCHFLLQTLFFEYEKRLQDSKINLYKTVYSGTFLMVQWLRLRTSTTGRTSLIPGQGTKILHATQYGQKMYTHRIPIPASASATNEGNSWLESTPQPHPSPVPDASRYKGECIQKLPQTPFIIISPKQGQIHTWGKWFWGSLT